MRAGRSVAASDAKRARRAPLARECRNERMITMATTRKDVEDAAAELAEPVAAQIAALRADMAELGGAGRPHRQGAGGGPEVGGRRNRVGRLRQGRGGDRRGAGRVAVARGRGGGRHATPAVRLAGARDARRASCSASCSGGERGAPLRDGLARRGGAHPQRRPARGAARGADRRRACWRRCSCLVLRAGRRPRWRWPTRYGTINALAIMAGGGAGRGPDLARRPRLGGAAAPAPRGSARGARPSALPQSRRSRSWASARPSRPTLGLGLVALGALLVLMRRDGDD